MKKFKTTGSNAIDPATTTSTTWGFRPVPNKGGKTLNCDPTLSKDDARKIINGGKTNA